MIAPLIIMMLIIAQIKDAILLRYFEPAFVPTKQHEILLMTGYCKRSTENNQTTLRSDRGYISNDYGSRAKAAAG